MNATVVEIRGPGSAPDEIEKQFKISKMEPRANKLETVISVSVVPGFT